MPFIIDGCNVLGQLKKLYKPYADKMLLEDIVLPYSRLKNKKIFLVFDNSDYNSHSYNHFVIENITVHYTHLNFKTADDIIIKMIQDSQDPRGLTIVSSDREIIDVAKIYQSKYIKSEDFLAEFQYLFSDKEPLETKKNLTNKDISEINNELMELWGNNKKS